MIENLLAILTNIHFQSTFFAYIIAQILKYCISILVYKFSDKEKRIVSNIKANSFAYYMVRNGGMPSSHCTSASALCASFALSKGVDSEAFYLALFFSAVLVSDAIGVRRQVGVIGEAMNTMVSKYNSQYLRSDQQENMLPHIKIIYGHTPSEAFVGVILGIVIAWLFSILY